MKFLTDYISDKQTEVFDKHGAFFAFGYKQLNEQKKPGVKYVSLGGGMIAPKENASQLIKDIKEVTNNGIKQDLAENGKEAIIGRELRNHEAFYTWETEQTAEALACYGITAEEVRKVFNKLKLLPVNQ